MRVGQNPSKMLSVPAYSPKKLGVAVLSHIPSHGGYYSEALEIVEIQIASLHKATSEFDLLLFDNGSCREVQTELARWHAQGDIHYLFLSQYNLGKTGAMNWILASMPNELVCFTDCDVLFRPGWIEKTEEIFDSFESAGIVTAQPCLHDILQGKGRAHLALADHPFYRSFDRLLQPEAVVEYGRGIDLGQAEVAGLQARPVRFVENRRTGVAAVVGASHMQFVIRKDSARRILPLPVSLGLNREEDRKFNFAIDQLDQVHLSTPIPYVYHMGNHLDDYTRAEIEKLGLPDARSRSSHPSRVSAALQGSPRKQTLMRLLSFFSRYSFLRNLLVRMYNTLFQYYAQER